MYFFNSIVFCFLFIIFNSIDSNLLSDNIANKILNYAHENQIPLILTNKITDDEAGSMSSTYNGYLKLSHDRLISVIIKYSSFKSIWYYVHMNTINDLYEYGCYSTVNQNQNEYLVFQEDKNRLVNESWVPSEVYIGFKGYLCEDLMPTLKIAHPKYSYFSFFKSLEQNDNDRTFFIIFKKLDNSISLKKYLEINSNRLTIDIARYLILSILKAIKKLKSMSIIHLDLNSGNIFLIDNDMNHPIKFIDFGIMKFIYENEELNVKYSEILHETFRKIFLNCPNCYSYSIPFFAQQYHSSFSTYSIDFVMNHPWLSQHTN